MKDRFFVLCQVHGWVDTVHNVEQALDSASTHRIKTHAPEFDGEILISKEQ